MKKMLPIAALLFLGMASVHGDYNSGGGKASGCGTPQCKPACPTPCPPCPCDEEGVGRPGQCLNMAFLPSAGPRVACGVDLFISADFIYWTAREDGLGYAATNWRSADDDANNVVNLNKGSVKHPDFGFSPGFKVDLGLMLCHDGWDVKGQYTWLFTGDEKDSTNQEDGTVSRLGGNWFGRRTGSAVAGTLSSPDNPMWTHADTKWDLHFQAIDLNLGRNFFVSQYLSMRPHFGFKGTWQSQEYKNVYRLADVTTTEQMVIDQDMDYWGFGIRTGFETKWYFTNSWSIYGNVALSALWSQFEVCRKDTDDADILTDTDPAFTNFNGENQFHTIVPVLELGLGLSWEMWSCDDAFHFQVQAGWEEQVWWKMNQFYRHYEEGNHGDLNLQGFTLHFRFGF